GALVRAPHFALFLVRQGHDPERQDLVDLGAVEEITGALRGDRGEVVEDDGRGEQVVPRPVLAGQDRPHALVLTGGGGLGERLRGGGQGNELGALGLAGRRGGD